VAGPWADGAHEIVVAAIDRAGNSAREVVRFVADTTPPEIHCGPEGGGVYHSFTGEHSFVGSASGRGRRAPALLWSRDRASWQPVGTAPWQVERREAPRFFLRRRGFGWRLYALPDVSMPIGRRSGVGVLATDPGSGTEAVEFRIEAAPGGSRLIVESADRLGNRSRVEWPLTRRRTRR
jgi:hypothetical protein